MCHEKISKLATNTVKQKKMLFRNFFEYYNGILVQRELKLDGAIGDFADPL